MHRTAILLGLSLALPAAVGAQDLPVTSWLVRGPLPADTGAAGVTRAYLDEAATLPTADTDWIPAEADSNGVVNFNALYRRSTDWHAAYGHVYVHSPADRTVLLVLDSDDDVVGIVNGQTVWTHVIPRGIGTGRDTVLVRLAGGWNSVLVKVRNRTGGFDLLGRFAQAAGAEPVADLVLATDRPAGMTTHNYPDAVIMVGPLRVRPVARWQRGEIRTVADLPVTAWGPDPWSAVTVEVRQGDARLLRETFERLEPGAPEVLELAGTFDAMRDAALGRRELSTEVASGEHRFRGSVTVDPEPLVRLLSARLALTDEVPPPGAITVEKAVPAVLSGRTLDLYPAGLGPDAQYTVNGQPATWAEGRVELCASCDAGADLRVGMRNAPDAPPVEVAYVRPRGPGFAELADGYDYAVELAGRAPAVERPDATEWLRAAGSAEWDALVAGYGEAYAPLATEIRRDTLLLVGNSHIDAAWLWRWQETIDVIRNTWSTSLKLARIFPGYVFAGSSAAYYAMLDEREPALADSLVATTEQGSWAPVGGWWVEADMNMPSGESLLRQGLYGQRYFQQRFGVRSRVAWTPDTFGYPWTVPQILRETGFDAFVTQKIRWNDSTEFPHNAFFWEGRDGTRIFTYNPYGYIHDLDPASLVPERVEDRERTGIGNQIVLYGVGDHGGGPTIAMLQRAENLRRVPTFPVMRYEAPEPAIASVRSAQPDSLFAVWDDELYLEYHRGTYTTHAAIKARNRRSEARLQIAEALAAVDTAPYPRGRLERAWRFVLFNQFHDILPGSGIDSIYPDAHAFYDTAWAVLDTITNASFARLRGRMDTRRDDAVVLFNPLGWARTDHTRVVAPSGDSVTIRGYEVPPLGAIVVEMEDSVGPLAEDLDEPEAGDGWIENAFLRVEVDTTTGEITRLYDKRTGREALAPGGRGNVLEVLDDRPSQWDAWNVMADPETWTVGAVRRYGGTAAGETEARLEVERTWGTSVFRQTLVLHRDRPYLEILHDVDWQERQKLLKLGFTLNVTADSATFEVPYGTIGRSGIPRTQAERAKFEVPGQRWADVSMGTHGVSVLTQDKYGWDYRGNVLRLSLLKAPIWPDSTADRGRHRFRVAVYPHEGDWRAARTDRLAAEYNVPMLAALEPRHRGPLEREFSFVEVESDRARLEWIKRAEDSDALVLRLVEWHGQGDDVEVRLACDVRSARRADALEEPDARSRIAVTDNAFWVVLRPHEIATVLVECA